jgi:U4/U6.U5 tri-snRNP-associated protein 2
MTDDKRDRESVQDDDDDDDQPLQKRQLTARKVVPGEQCPFLDTIARQVCLLHLLIMACAVPVVQRAIVPARLQNLDFDFEKCCSVSLSRVNIYACLVCGNYFQGRGPGTHVHTHSVEDNHHLFMKLDNGRVFCVPENYEVVDRSLKDIQHVLNPLYDADDLKQLDEISWARTLDGSDYMPGLVGLNNMKRNDYMNVIIQSLVRVPRLRCAFAE